MGNLCSIYHKHFDTLISLTNSYNKAVVLDKFIFWWQISSFSLDDDRIWFTRSIENIAKELGLSASSINRYLKEFKSLGLIETRIKLFNKKHLYVRITEKLLGIIGAQSSHQPEDNSLHHTRQNQQPVQKCSFLTHDDTIENVNLEGSIYKVKDSNNYVNNTTVSDACAVDNSKPNCQNPISSFYPTYAIEETIGERLSLREKNYIKGMMHKVQKQHGVHFSSPEQVFAEITFAVLHEQQLQGVSNFNHKIQIIAKLLREKRWLTPKGFYNHSEFGTVFKKRETKSTFISNQHQKPQENKFALEQQKTMLRTTLRQQSQIGSGEGVLLRDALTKVKQNPARWGVIETASKSLINSYTIQFQLMKELFTVSTLCADHHESTELYKASLLSQHLDGLNHLEESTHELAQIVFDAYCDLMKLIDNKPRVGKLYDVYLELSNLNTMISKAITPLHEQVKLEYAA